MVPDLYPQPRSMLVICHGYLVCERHWHGASADDGDIGRLVEGMALDGQLVTAKTR
jgi:hypothetical protein